MTSLSKGKYTGMNTNIKDLTSKLKSVNLKSAEGIRTHLVSGKLSYNNNTKINPSYYESHKNSALNSFRTTGIFGMKFKTTKHSPEKNNQSLDKSKQTFMQNSVTNSIHNQHMGNNILDPPITAIKDSEEGNLDIIKKKILNKKKMDPDTKQLDFTNPTHSEEAKTNKVGLNNFQIFSKSPSNTNVSEKEKPKTSQNSIYSASNINNSINSNIKLSMTKSNSIINEDRTEYNHDVAPSPNAKRTEDKRMLTTVKPNLNTYFKSNESGKIVTKVSHQEAILNYKKKISPSLLAGKISATTPTTNKNSRKNSQEKKVNLLKEKEKANILSIQNKIQTNFQFNLNSNLNFNILKQSANNPVKKKPNGPISFPISNQHSKANSKLYSKSSSRTEEKLEKIENVEKKTDFVITTEISKNKPKDKFPSFKKHSTNTNSPSHFNILNMAHKHTLISGKNSVQSSLINSKKDKNNSSLNKHEENSKSKPVSLKIASTQPNPSGIFRLTNASCTNSKDFLLKHAVTIKKSINTSQMNKIKADNDLDYKNTSNLHAPNNTDYNINISMDEENLMNITSSSVKSTVRESNYYKRESEKISLFIKQYYEKNGGYPASNLNFYKYGRLLGRGAFGKVNLGLHIMSGRLVAVKSFNKANLPSKNSREKIHHETNIMRNLRHNSIVKIFEVLESQKYLIIVMENVCGGDLLTFVRKRTKLNEITSKFIFRQLIEALQYIHSQNIVHRDIKLDNILIDLNNNIKICDFGVGKMVKRGDTMYDQCGTPAYIAPEILLNKGYEGFGVDIWSAGVVLYTMLSGVVPFKANNMNDLHSLIIEAKYNALTGISEEAGDLINKILETNPKKRLSVEEILNHPWLKSNEDLINGKAKMNLFTNAERILLNKSNVDYCFANKDDIIEHFTLKNLDSLQDQENQNVNTKSAILAPYNSSHKISIKELDMQSSMIIEQDVMKFCGKVKELNRQYELNNNVDFDNGLVINHPEKEKEESFEEEIKESNVPSPFKNSKQVSKPTSPHNEPNKISELPTPKEDSNRNRKKNESNSITNAHTFILDENVVRVVESFGYKKEFLLKSLYNNELNYATATYYLLLNSSLE